MLFFYLTGKDTKLPCFLPGFQQQPPKNRLILELILHKDGICTNKDTLGIKCVAVQKIINIFVVSDRQYK
jgi:hypothetical protein